MSDNNGKPNVIDMDEKKLSGLLTNLEILENHIFLNARISYDTALGAIASIVLILTYAYINNQFSLLFAIPFIIYVEGKLYLHLMRLNIEYDTYGMRIEDTINELLKSNTISQIHDLGVFSKTVKPSYYVKLIGPFALFYIFTACFGINELVTSKGRIIAIALIFIYGLMAIDLILTVSNLKQKFNDQYQKLFPDSK